MGRAPAYREGDWFVVPLRGGGTATGLIARANSKGVLLGYFFGPKRLSDATLEELRDLRAEDAMLVAVFGHLGLKSGTWRVLGRTADWDRARWPTPTFARYEELTGRSFLVFYDDDDPNHVVREEEVPSGRAERLPRDGGYGAGAIEKLLGRLLS